MTWSAKPFGISAQAAQPEGKIKQSLVRRGLRNGELTMHYQPQHCLQTGAFIRAEALVRWEHPEQGTLLPNRFLPSMETTPLYRELNLYTLAHAMSTAADWHAQGQQIGISINIPPRLVCCNEMVDLIAAFYVEKGEALPPQSIELEILEDESFTDSEQAWGHIKRLQALGLSVAIDDLGKGYATPDRLDEIPVDRVKVDRHLISKASANPDEVGALAQLVDKAREGGRLVVAEGVEDIAAVGMLRQIGFDHAQGYGIARPMPYEEMTQWHQAGPVKALAPANRGGLRCKGFGREC